MYTYIVGESRNGRQVYANIINSAAGRYFSRQPYLVGIARSVVADLDLADDTVHVTHDVGRVIGNTNIVLTGEKDTIFYAHQPKREQMMRFVKHRSMELSSELSLVLVRDDEGNYELADVWIGPACPPFPGAQGANADSSNYWQTHALTAGSEPIVAQSVTNVCPY